MTLIENKTRLVNQNCPVLLKIELYVYLVKIDFPLEQTSFLINTSTRNKTKYNRQKRFLKLQVQCIALKTIVTSKE